MMSELSINHNTKIFFLLINIIIFFNEKTNSDPVRLDTEEYKLLKFNKIDFKKNNLYTSNFDLDLIKINNSINKNYQYLMFTCSTLLKIKEPKKFIKSVEKIDIEFNFIVLLSSQRPINDIKDNPIPNQRIPTDDTDATRLFSITSAEYLTLVFWDLFESYYLSGRFIMVDPPRIWKNQKWHRPSPEVKATSWIKTEYAPGEVLLVVDKENIEIYKTQFVPILANAGFKVDLLLAVNISGQ